MPDVVTLLYSNVIYIVKFQQNFMHVNIKILFLIKEVLDDELTSETAIVLGNV